MLNKSGRATRSRSCDALRGGTVAALALASLVLLCSPAIAALNIFACEPEWAALATELGGNDVSVFAATGARQDPHQVQARPALIAKLRQADLAVCTGAELEIGWLPVLLRQASNGRVQPGSAGFFAAAEQVRLKEVPTRLDRSEGDIHAAGNPHIQTDPRNIRAVAQALGQRLAQIDAAHAAAYAERLRSFTQRFDQAIQRWEQMAAPLKGTSVVSYHKSWVYLYDWVGIKGVATVEPKPGVPPGSAYLAQLLDEIPRRGAKMVVYAAYEDPRASQFVGEKSGIPAVMLPFTVGGTDQAKDLVSLFDDTIARLLAALGGKAG